MIASGEIIFGVFFKHWQMLVAKNLAKGVATRFEGACNNVLLVRTRTAL
jgi:hypothetical protein